MVVVGLPVLFATAAVGAFTYAIMKTILDAAYIRCQRGARSFAEYWRPKNVVPLVPTRNDPTRERRKELNKQRPQISLNRSQDSEDAKSPDRVELAISAPIPKNAAEERNKSLLKFLALFDTYLIDPWIIKNEKLLQKAKGTEDPFLQQMIGDQKALKDLLRSIALWQLSQQWDVLEAKFVKMETPEPPTLQSLKLQVETLQLPPPISQTLVELIESESNEKVAKFQEEVTKSGLPNQQKLNLMSISLQINTIISQAPIDEKLQANETEELRKKFATIMHNGMATSLTQIALIIEGWVTVIQQTASKPPRPHSPQAVKKEEETDSEDVCEASFIQSDVERIVRGTSEVLSRELSKHYFLPLWKKQQKEWEDSLSKRLGEEEVTVGDSSDRLANSFMRSELTEEEFLLNSSSYKFSTALTANIAFFRAIRIIQSKDESLEQTIKALPSSLFLQLEPILESTLYKSRKMMSEINLETTVPRVVNYAIDLLECCRAMQSVRGQNPQHPYGEEASYDEEPVPEDNRFLITALEKGKQSENAALVRQHFLEIPDAVVTGQAVIEELGIKAHKAVRLNRPEIQERTWIHTTKERLEGLLRVKAADYTQELESQWLITLFKSKPNGNGESNLLVSLLSLQNKLWKLLPGSESFVKILMKGVQAFIEEEACEGVQNELNKLTSTGFLSSTIGVTVVKGLVDQSKDANVWKENLPLLQQAYTFLQPEEKKLILNHLNAQFSVEGGGAIIKKRKQQLETPPSNSEEKNLAIKQMKQEEESLSQSLSIIKAAYYELKKDEASYQAEINSLEEAYDKIKREKDLKSFARIKGLVIFVADDFLSKKLVFSGGSHLKEIILAVIHEAYTLLSYQEVVKHWIFTIVDLLLDELEEAASSKPTSFLAGLDEDETGPSETPSILDFIPAQTQQTLLNKLCELMDTSSKQEASGWFNVGSWMKTGARAVTSWAPGTIWGYIEQAFKEDLRKTPQQLTDIAFEKLEKFAVDPQGLSDSVIQSLVETVADPRLEQLNSGPPSPLSAKEREKEAE